MAIALVHPVGTFFSVVTLSAKCTLDSDRHTTLDPRISGAGLVRSCTSAFMYRDRSVAWIPVTHRRAGNGGPQLGICLQLDLCARVIGAERVCDLSRQVPAME